MTSIEDLEKQVDAILKRNDEADFENKINADRRELNNEENKYTFVIMVGFILFGIFAVGLMIHQMTIHDIKTHALAAQNITEYISSLKV